MKRFNIYSIIIMALLILPGSVMAEGLNINDGNWKITTTLEFDGKYVPMPPLIYWQCLSSQYPIPRNPEARKCRIKESRVENGTVYWLALCNGTESRGQVTYNGKTLEGFAIAKPETGVTVKSIISGKRIGNCS